MKKDQARLDNLNAVIREHRSGEASFEKLCAALDDEIKLNDEASPYKDSLLEIKQKAVEEYIKAKEKSGSAWPEFEKFVSAFEKAVLQELKDL